MTAPLPAAVQEEVVRLLAEAWLAEKAGTCPLAQIRMGSYTAFTMIAALQVAWRHPGLSKVQRDVIRELAGQVQPLFGGVLAEVLEAGWDVSQDVAAGPQC